MTINIFPEDKDKHFASTQNSRSKGDDNNNFSLSENAKSLGILRIAREHNTIVVEIKNGQSNDDPFVMRRAIDFKDWNNFVQGLKSNLSDDLKFEYEKMQLNRIIANVETVLNKNYEAIKTPAEASATAAANNNIKSQLNLNRPEKSDGSSSNNQNKSGTNNLKKDNADSERPIPFQTINQLVKKQTGTFNTKAAIVSITPIMHAISKIKWKCTNDATDRNGNPYCSEPYNERIFDQPLLRLDGLKLYCNSCFRPAPDVVEANVLKEWINYIIIQVQDDDYSTLIDDDLQKLVVLVYDEYVDSVHIGETIKLHGNIKVPLKSYDKPYSGRTVNSNLSSVLYAESITPERREEIKITERDEEAFEKFVSYPNLMQRLAAMFAPNVIGHQDKKIAVLLAAAGAPKTPNFRGIIHVLFVGPPGTAKTTLSYEAVNLIPNSRFTAAQTSSAKTILAIVEVQGDVKIIRYGAIPLAKNAICVIDEIGAMPYEDQASLFNAMEHGEFPLNKHGESRMISAPTTIISTSNPRNANASWSNSTKVSKDEIPLRRALIDRHDIVLIFKGEDTEESATEYAKEKMKLQKRKPHNYRFLRKLLQHVKSTIAEVTLTKEAETMITKYYASLKTNENLAITNRGLDTMIRICKAWARLHLKNIVDVHIVNQVQSYFSEIILQYGEVINAVSDPRETACQQIIEIIKQTKVPILFEHAARQACELNKEVRDYIGSNMKLRDNSRLREVSERVREYNNVRSVGIRPLVLEWIKTVEETSSNKQSTAAENSSNNTTEEKEI
jgi:DNA replicative helicase MCM subunit Mcm2 (Cdc46/Mcm family)